MEIMMITAEILKRELSVVKTFQLPSERKLTIDRSRMVTQDQQLTNRKRMQTRAKPESWKITSMVRGQIGDKSCRWGARWVPDRVGGEELRWKQRKECRTPNVSWAKCPKCHIAGHRTCDKGDNQPHQRAQGQDRHGNQKRKYSVGA